MSDNESLVSKIDKEAASLLEKASFCEDYKERAAIFVAVTKWVSIKNKLDETDDVGDKFEQYRREIGNGSKAGTNPGRA